jgi:tetratricopeptide (TPR) repeat protein
VSKKYLFKAPAIIFCCLILFFVSCSTKKNTFTRRVYHNLTAHYNAYFNGKEALNEGKTELAKKNKDNFSKILPVFELGTKSDAQSVYNFMDRAIEKASIIIQRHSIFIKGVEHVKWIDDAFMMIGKSYYYKQEYDLALQTFNYVLNKYKDGNCKYEAIIWKARVMTQQGKIEEAEVLLNSIEKKIEKNKANRVAEKLYPLAYADVLLKQQKYEEGIDYVKQALHLNKSKHIRTRLDFILAQAYQRSGNAQQANKYYKKVLGMNPIYDMEFATKINLAKNYEVTLGGSGEIKKQLNRMIRDEKNKEYLDQIHYALAEIYLKENDQENAIKQLKKSAQKSVSNNYQKSISYLKLGDLYFAEPDYKNAQRYYDSCIITLPKDFPNYQLIENKKNTLNELVKNLNIVALEDSLQMLANLSPAERNKKIIEHIAELNKEEERKKQEESQRLIELAQLQQTALTTTQTTGSWYFYNPSSMSFGFNEFVHKWGNRKYEDLWRLSNKTVTDFGNNDIKDDADSNKTSETKKEADLKNPKTYLAKIPLTPESIEISNKKISEALFNIGVIYKESLDELDKSIEAFTKIEKRYPNSKQIQATYYNLYEIYLEKNEPPRANYYKDLLLTKYPESEFAQIISDPNYYQKREEIKGRLAVFYKDTYLAFKDGKYMQVIKNADSAILLKKDAVLTAKFDFLKCLSIGKTQPKETFILALKGIVKNYPETDVKTEAQNILDFLSTPTDNKITTDGVILKDTSAVVIQKDVLYKYDPTSFHFYIIVFDVKNVSINDMKYRFSNHNSITFSSRKLTINTLFLDDKHEVLNVSRFESKDDALDYLLSVENSPEIIALLGKTEYKHFVISATNYPVFYKNKNVEKYLEFYNKNYSKQ